MKRCKHCGGPLSGPGSNNAVLCLTCWAAILVRVMSGETQYQLAQEYGVSRQAVSQKASMYGEDE